MFPGVIPGIGGLVGGKLGIMPGPGGLNPPWLGGKEGKELFPAPSVGGGMPGSGGRNPL